MTTAVLTATPRRSDLSAIGPASGSRSPRNWGTGGFRVAEVADGREFGRVAALTFGPEGMARRGW
jgi:hypothetical protein